MTEVQYVEKIIQIDENIETLEYEMRILKEEILDCGKTGDYSDVNEKTTIFLDKADKVFALMDERRALNSYVKINGFNDPDLDD